MTFIFYDILEGNPTHKIPVSNIKPITIPEDLTIKELIPVNTRLQSLVPVNTRLQHTFHSTVGGMDILSDIIIIVMLSEKRLRHLDLSSIFTSSQYQGRRAI